MPVHLLMSAAQVETIRRAAAAAYPEECCGLLVGRGADELTVTRVVTTLNVAADPRRRFAIDPQAQFDLLRATRGTSERVIGHYHSHPDGSTALSAHDLAVAFDPEAVWVLVALNKDAVQYPQAFVLGDDGANFTGILLTKIP